MKSVNLSNPDKTFNVIKSFLFIAIAFILLYALYMFFKGFQKVTDFTGEIGTDILGTTNEEKAQVISDTSYQDAIKWLDPKNGFIALAKSPKYKNVSTSNYLLSKGIDGETLTKKANQIWDAKVPFYIDQQVVYNAFTTLPSKAAISLMANRFNYFYEKKYNGAALAKWLPQYFKLTEMKALAKIINSKPEL